MTHDLTQGGAMRAMVLFSLPMIAGNLLQQLYNVVDTLIVGRVLGTNALAAVGSSYTLMVFLTSVNLGLCLGSGVVFSHFYGARQEEELRSGIFNAFVLIGGLTLLLNLLAFALLEPLLRLLNIQPEALAGTRDYLRVVFCGILFTFLFNFFAAVLRSIGNSLMPLLFLAVSAVLNILLDILFVLPLGMGVRGAALATVIAQGVSALLVTLYFLRKAPDIRPARRHMRVEGRLVRLIAQHSVLTSAQQSVMNFGILMIQGLVNSFGVQATAAFAAAVKIDSFAYMPAQDFANAFSTYTAQNYGARKADRIRAGIRGAAGLIAGFCLAVSVLIFVFARRLMLFFVQPHELAVIGIGVRYLRIEGSFYILIGFLFLFYALYRGLGRPGMSLVLTVFSLGTRVLLSYLLAPVPAFGLTAIWCAIPTGWLLADLVGILYYRKNKMELLP